MSLAILDTAGLHGAGAPELDHVLAVHTGPTVLLGDDHELLESSWEPSLPLP